MKELPEGQRKTHFTLLDDCERRMGNEEANSSYMEEVLNKQEEFGFREVIGYGLLVDISPRL